VNKKGDRVQIANGDKIELAPKVVDTPETIATAL
jgi:hypothetical protein